MVANREISNKGKRIRSPRRHHKIAAGRKILPHVCRHVLGARTARRTGVAEAKAAARFFA